MYSKNNCIYTLFKKRSRIAFDNFSGNIIIRINQLFSTKSNKHRTGNALNNHIPIHILNFPCISTAVYWKPPLPLRRFYHSLLPEQQPCRTALRHLQIYPQPAFAAFTATDETVPQAAIISLQLNFSRKLISSFANASIVLLTS